MAGVCRDEAAYSAQGMGIYEKNLTADDFLSIVTNQIKDRSMGRTAEEIRDFYLADTDRSDPTVVRQRLVAFMSDTFLKCGTYLFAKQYAQHSKNKNNTFFYELTRAAVMPKSSPIGPDARTIAKLGVPHAIDNLYVFGFPFLIDWEDKTDISFSKQYMKYWTDFAKYGYNNHQVYHLGR